MLQLDHYEFDYIKLFDGNNTDKAYLMTDLLGEGYTPSDAQSVSRQLTLKFYTSKAYTGVGFKAKILIQDGPRDKAVNACSVANPCDVNQGHCFYDGQCIGDLRCGQNNCPKELGYDHGTNMAEHDCNGHNNSYCQSHNLILLDNSFLRI